MMKKTAGRPPKHGVIFNIDLYVEEGNSGKAQEKQHIFAFASTRHPDTVARSILLARRFSLARGHGVYRDWGFIGVCGPRHGIF